MGESVFPRKSRKCSDVLFSAEPFILKIEALRSLKFETTLRLIGFAFAFFLRIFASFWASFANWLMAGWMSSKLKRDLFFLNYFNRQFNFTFFYQLEWASLLFCAIFLRIWKQNLPLKWAISDVFFTRCFPIAFTPHRQVCSRYWTWNYFMTKL